MLLHIEATFLFSLVWSVGGTGASVEGRVAFDAFLRVALAVELEGYAGPSGERCVLERRREPRKE